MDAKVTLIFNEEVIRKAKGFVESACKCIITEDISDFHFATIEIVSSENFFLKYMITVKK